MRYEETEAITSTIRRRAWSVFFVSVFLDTSLPFPHHTLLERLHGRFPPSFLLTSVPACPHRVVPWLPSWLSACLVPPRLQRGAVRLPSSSIPPPSTSPARVPSNGSASWRVTRTARK